MSLSDVAVSAPGKVLFAGGFLVLDREYTGLVFGLDARIHIHVQPWERPREYSSTSNDDGPFIFVQSPQFRDARWLYKISAQPTSDDQAIGVVQVVNTDAYTKTCNKFVETTIRYVLTYLAHIHKDIGQSVKVTIVADNDYYSQPSSDSPLPVKGGFSDFGVRISEAHKTGLGSSAALVTSLVAGILTYYTADKSLPEQVIHNLAQASHCAAQGKVGSGFDVAAAVYGTCVYRRFSPSVLESIGEPTSAGFGRKLHDCVEDLNTEHKWNAEVSPKYVQIPDSLMIVMCDVDCGSESPGMAKRVLQWRKEQQKEANLLWAALQKGAAELTEQLRSLCKAAQPEQSDIEKLASIIQIIRGLVRQMSAKSNVPIEPDVITELLDYCTTIPGVVGGVAPGAGGYDAVSLLVKNDPMIRKELNDKLTGWISKKKELSATIGRVRLLEVKQSEEGIKLEDGSRYEEWTN